MSDDLILRLVKKMRQEAYSEGRRERHTRNLFQRGWLPQTLRGVVAAYRKHLTWVTGLYRGRKRA